MTKQNKQVTGKPRPKRTTLIVPILILLVVALTVFINGSEQKDQDNQAKLDSNQATSQEEAQDTDESELENPGHTVTVEEQSKTVSIALNMYTKPDKSEVEIVLKNTSTTKSAYKFSSQDIYKYKILNESDTVAKEGSFGKLETDSITLKANEEHKTVFNYDAIQKALPQGFYTLEVTVNNKDLSGSKTSTTFTVNDFDTSVTAIKTDTLVIRSIDESKNSLEGVLNGVSLITFTYTDKLKPELKKYKVGQDVLEVTYLKDKGVYTIQALSKANEPNKVPETVTEPPKDKE